MIFRPPANTGIEISKIALGCWPIAGMTSPGTSDAESMATVRACFDLGINHLDTAYVYGRSGESERLIARALGGGAARW
jgi:aryl-alcohol dehydrogenase-like predicted oxidoreductase